MGRVDGKVAIVTGAASGLGLASAQMLIKEGAKVLMTDIDSRPLETEAHKLGDAAFAITHDVTDEQQWIDVMGTCLEKFGRLDCLVNSAGVGFMGDVENISFADWKKVHAINLDGTFLGTKYAIKAIKQSDGGGSIINLSSVSGLVGGYNFAAYNSSKGGVRLLTKSTALYCARMGYGIRCNSVHPTFIDTPMVQALIDNAPDPEKAERGLVRQIPLGRLGKAEEVAMMVVYLASDESAFVTGSEMVIDGGCTAQ